MNENFVKSFLITTATTQYAVYHPEIRLRICKVKNSSIYIYNFIRHLGSHKTLKNYTEKKKKNKQISHSQHSHNIRRNTGLHIYFDQ